PGFMASPRIQQVLEEPLFSGRNHSLAHTGSFRIRKYQPPAAARVSREAASGHGLKCPPDESPASSASAALRDVGGGISAAATGPSRLYSCGSSLKRKVRVPAFTWAYHRRHGSMFML